MAFSRHPYTKKMSFLRPPIQQNAIFETPLYKKMVFSRPPIQNKLPSSPLLIKNIYDSMTYDLPYDGKGAVNCFLFVKDL